MLTSHFMCVQFFHMVDIDVPAGVGAPPLNTQLDRRYTGTGSLVGSVQRKTSAVENFTNWWIFMEKTFADCSLVPPKNTTPPNFMEMLETTTVLMYAGLILHMSPTPTRSSVLQCLECSNTHAMD